MVGINNGGGSKIKPATTAANGAGKEKEKEKEKQGDGNSAAPAGVSCPYCQSRFGGKEELSKHIDRIHHGSGLLEGNLGRW